jgi:DNA helicase-2/ATP-dependent DNA helicase PcrA
MIGRAIDLLEGRSLPTELSFNLIEGVTVSCRADHIGEKDGRIIIQRFKASRLASRERGKARYVVMQAAIRARHGGMPVQFEHASLVDGARQDGTIDQSKLQAEIQTLKGAIASIAAGHFAPTPSDYQCPRCPYFFICPSHGPVQTQP